MKLSYQHVNIFQKNTILKTSNCVLACIVVRQAQFAPWGNAMCVIKRLIVTDGYRVRIAQLPVSWALGQMAWEI